MMENCHNATAMIKFALPPTVYPLNPENFCFSIRQTLRASSSDMDSRHSVVMLPSKKTH